MTVAIGSDHAGFKLKNDLKALLEKQGYKTLDVGTFAEDSVDYPDFAYGVVNAIKSNKAARGVLVCGSGQGVAIAANREASIRAALCRDVEDAALARQHNDANVLALGARKTDAQAAAQILDTFLKTEFEGGRHARRVEKLANPK